MKIIYCIPSAYNSGGMERVLSNKANYLVDKLNYDVSIITTDQKNNIPFFSFSEKIKHYDLEINYSDDYNASIYKKNILLLRKKSIHKKKLKTLLNELQADIVISMFGSEVYFLTDIKDGSKKILEIHFSKFFRLQHERTGIKRMIDKYRTKVDDNVIKKYDRFVVLTNEDAKNWPKEAKIQVISNAYSFKPKSQALLNNKEVLSIGRLTNQKGYDRLIPAWKKVNDSYPDWNLKIVGNDGGEKNNLMLLIRKLNLENSINIVSPTQEIEQVYLNSSIYVMSSRYEGMPLVLLEAMACGLPCVSFNCPCGPSDIITDQEDGFLVSEGNIEGLVKAMIKLIENEKLRKIMGRKASQNIRRYSQNSIMNQWNELFIELTD